MLKFTKKHARFLTLAIAIAMIVATILAIPASAHTTGQIYFVYEIDGKKVVSQSLRDVPVCNCSNPSITDYLNENPPHKYTREGHTTPLVKHCANCDWKFYSTAGTVGGCAPYCTFPIAPWLLKN